MRDLEKIKEVSEPCYNFIKNNDLSKLEIGRYELEDGAYVLIQSYTSKLRNVAKYESHDVKCDIQYVISGKELISMIPVEKLVEKVPYNPEKDITYYENSVEGIDHLLCDGDFLIISPGEGHMPGVCVNEQSEVHKAVFKFPYKKK